VNLLRVRSEFGCYLPVSFCRGELSSDGKHLPALGTTPSDGVAVNPVNHNQTCHEQQHLTIAQFRLIN
jgi:hypothetical protein